MKISENQFCFLVGSNPQSYGLAFSVIANKEGLSFVQRLLDFDGYELASHYKFNEILEDENTHLIINQEAKTIDIEYSLDWQLKYAEIEIDSVKYCGSVASSYYAIPVENTEELEAFASINGEVISILGIPNSVILHDINTLTPIGTYKTDDILYLKDMAVSQIALYNLRNTLEQTIDKF